MAQPTNLFARRTAEATKAWSRKDKWCKTCENWGTHHTKSHAA